MKKGCRARPTTRTGGTGGTKRCQPEPVRPSCCQCRPRPTTRIVGPRPRRFVPPVSLPVPPGLARLTLFRPLAEPSALQIYRSKSTIPRAPSESAPHPKATPFTRAALEIHQRNNDLESTPSPLKDPDYDPTPTLHPRLVLIKWASQLEGLFATRWFKDPARTGQTPQS